MSNIVKLNNGVGYYNIDNSDNKENRENIANTSSSWPGGKAAVNYSTQGEAEPNSKVEIQAATPEDPNLDNTLRIVSQIFYNTNSTQKHKIKVKMHHTDQDPTEWIASMNTDARVFRKYQKDMDLAREWIQITREKFSLEQGYKKPYYGKFHLVADGNGKTGGTQKELGCFASMAYNKDDQSWYAMIKIFDFFNIFEYDYNYTNTQQAQGVKAQIVWNNPRLQKQKRPLTYRERKLKGK